MTFYDYYTQRMTALQGKKILPDDFLEVLHNTNPLFVALLNNVPKEKAGPAISQVASEMFMLYSQWRAEYIKEYMEQQLNDLKPDLAPYAILALRDLMNHLIDVTCGLKTQDIEAKNE